MAIYKIIAVLVAAYVLLQFFVLPEAENKWRANKGFEKITKIGLLAGMKAAIGFIQIAVVSYVLLITALWLWTSSQGARSPQDYLQIIERAEHSKDALREFKEGVIGPILSFTAMAVLCFLAFRRQKEEMKNEFDDIIARESARLKKQLDEGKWEELEPTTEMAELLERMSIGQKVLDKLEKEKPSPIRDGQIRNVNSYMKAFTKQFQELDLLRRMDLGSDTAKESGTTGKKSWWPRLGMFFISKSFVADSSLLGKGLSACGTVALCVSIIGVSASPFEEHVHDKLDSLWSLQVEASSEKAKQSWEKASGQDGQATVQTAVSMDVNTINSLARLIVQQTNYPYLQPGYLHSDSSYAARSTAAREEIFSEATWTDAVKPKASTASARAQSNDAEDAVNTVMAFREDGDAPSKTEAWVAKNVTEQAGKAKPEIWEKIQKKVRDHIEEYGKPAKTADFAKVVLDQVLDPVGDLAGEQMPDYLKSVRPLLTKGAKELIAKKLETMWEHVLTDLAGDKTLGEALARVRDDKTISGLSAVEAKIAETLGNDLGSRVNGMADIRNLTRQGMVENEDAQPWIDDTRKFLELVQERSDRTKPRMTSALVERYSEFLDQFEDYYPLNQKSVAATARSSFLSSHTNVDIGKEGDVAASRAFDYEQTSVFYKTGGVVIGKSATNSSDFHVNLERLVAAPSGGDKLNLYAVSSDGRRLPVGLFEKNIIYHAIVYAADERPATVTIINSPQPGLQKILLHPALLDSELGCEVINLDRFIFDYIDQGTRKADLSRMNTIRALDLLYQYTYLKELGAITKNTSAQSYAANFEKALIEGFKAEDMPMPSSSDIRNSPLEKLQKLYSSSLVGDMEGCMDSIPILKSFGTCVEKRLGDRPKKNRHPFEESVPGLPDMHLVSAVRETDYMLDSDLTFAKPGSEADAKPSSLSPLVFNIQAAYASGAQSLSTDESVWKFDDLTSGIGKSISSLQMTNASAAKILHDVRNFTYLQRLFRVAFAGEFGENFEVESILDLARATKSKSNNPIVRTARWVQIHVPPDKSQSQSPRDGASPIGIAERELLSKIAAKSKIADGSTGLTSATCR